MRACLQFHVVLTVFLLLELVIGVLIFVFYYVPSVRHQVGFLSPDEALRQAVVRYRDDDDLRDMIDVIQREVGLYRRVGIYHLGSSCQHRHVLLFISKKHFPPPPAIIAIYVRVYLQYKFLCFLAV